ncbi:MAG: septum formation initiator family protein [Candidatus Saccharimonadales bacterium]
MQEKLKPYLKQIYAFVLRLQDIRFAGQMLFVVIVLLISWSGVKAIESNYQLQRQISALRQQTDIQNLKNTNLKLQNQYFNTNQYLELSARQNFGLAAPGEKELIVPKDVALAHTVPLPNMTEGTEPRVTKQSRFEQNYQAWINFFMHRSDT